MPNGLHRALSERAPGGGSGCRCDVAVSTILCTPTSILRPRAAYAHRRVRSCASHARPGLLSDKRPGGAPSRDRRRRGGASWPVEIHAPPLSPQPQIPTELSQTKSPHHPGVERGGTPPEDSGAFFLASWHQRRRHSGTRGPVSRGGAADLRLPAPSRDTPHARQKRRRPHEGRRCRHLRA